MENKIALFMLWFAVWILLSWPPDGKDVTVGLIVALVVLAVTVDVFSASHEDDPGSRRITLAGKFRRLPWLAVYVGVFVWECVKANLDVAYRVIHPRLPIRPGTVAVKTALRSDIALTFLANSITLTPGTTTVDVDKARGCIYIHRLFMKETPAASVEATIPVVEKFERILRKVFE